MLLIWACNADQATPTADDQTIKFRTVGETEFLSSSYSNSGGSDTVKVVMPSGNHEWRLESDGDSGPWNAITSGDEVRVWCECWNEGTYEGPGGCNVDWTVGQGWRKAKCEAIQGCTDEGDECELQVMIKTSTSRDTISEAIIVRPK